MGNMREEAIVDLKVDDSEATTKWAENKERIKEINSELRKLKEAGEAGSEGYKALQTELRDVKNEQKDLVHNIDLSQASINQMQAALSHWTREAKNAEKGSEEWIAATKQIDEIKPVLSEAQHELKSFGTEVEKQPSLWDNMKVSVMSVFTGTAIWDMAKAAGAAILDW